MRQLVHDEILGTSKEVFAGVVEINALRRDAAMVAIGEDKPARVALGTVASVAVVNDPREDFQICPEASIDVLKRAASTPQQHELLHRQRHLCLALLLSALTYR